jgi:hypothetical protein
LEKADWQSNGTRFLLHEAWGLAAAFAGGSTSWKAGRRAELPAPQVK